MRQKFVLGSLMVFLVLLVACGGSATQASPNPTSMPTQTQVVMPTATVQEISVPVQTPLPAPVKTCTSTNYVTNETLYVVQYADLVKFQYKGDNKEFNYELNLTSGKISRDGDESVHVLFSEDGEFNLMGLPAGNFNSQTSVFTTAYACR